MNESNLALDGWIQTADNDTSDYTYSGTQYSLMDVVCYKYLGPTLCALGIIGNTISLFVLTRDQIKEGSYLYLKALAVTDMFALAVSFPFMVFCMGSVSYYWKWYECYVFLPFANMFTAASVWITTVMTIERFIVVKFPLWSRWRCTRFGAQVRILIVLVIALTISIPRYLAFTITPFGSGYRLARTPFQESKAYYVLDMFCIATLHFLPLFILGIVNTVLIYEVQNARIIREELNIRNNQESEFQKDQRRFTITLISIVVLFLCFILPATVSDILLYSKFGLQPNGFQIMRTIRNIANVLLWCSLSFNFLLYCAFNKRFVRVLRNSVGRGIFRFRNYSFRARSVKTSNSTTL
ncbi:hypothetical protein FSP39_003990 [Pinctada imbricata]|uniref:G-protein coupled receptors family 1 profile domain-containing protein n=1 Tax=Pinctada imbricata TaxID=66713 RepID=A0AA89BVZ4_PINIB|nr:hypothetical protein FSP39_003990 [Pinctada imbricata]